MQCILSALVLWTIIPLVAGTDGGTNTGVLVGGTVGAILGISVLAAVLIFYLRRRWRRQDANASSRLEKARNVTLQSGSVNSLATAATGPHPLQSKSSTSLYPPPNRGHSQTTLSSSASTPSFKSPSQRSLAMDKRSLPSFPVSSSPLARDASSVRSAQQLAQSRQIEVQERISDLQSQAAAQESLGAPSSATAELHSWISFLNFVLNSPWAKGLTDEPPSGYTPSQASPVSPQINARIPIATPLSPLARQVVSADS